MAAVDREPDWSIKHPFLSVAANGLALFVAGAVMGYWSRAALVAVGVVTVLGIDAVRDRAAFRRGGMEEVRRRRNRRAVVSMVGLGVLILVLVVIPVLA